MSTAELAAETVFDAEERITRLDIDSLGLQMTRDEVLAVDDWDERYRSVTSTRTGRTGTERGTRLLAAGVP